MDLLYIRVMDKFEKWVKARTQVEAARLLGTTQPNISYWISQGEVPSKRVREVSKITGIARKHLCPSVFG